ncbi:Shikimate kinase [Rhodovastum atsumiense]|uniref:Shikimate kinase n=1 Tax=Rhodovastum atsumiense TaxID=504468 RepID=A0A5M6ILS8_9PROT|nr:shikimate kinase [Rhodovastum atsumiense]KAA5608887.1 shikimate kinase [Rhodovastum atsumiense]CAH2602314.1 Shikimate kinase [Rhodovastum atsumiense]
MPVIWLNGTIGAGKSAVGQALAVRLPASRFLDGDDLAGPSHLPNPRRWRMALDALLRAAARPGRQAALVIAYPLDAAGWRRLRTVCGRGRRALVVLNLAPPLAMTLRGRGGRNLSPPERARVRVMRAEGYHRRPFATATLANAASSAAGTARRIARLLPVWVAHRPSRNGIGPMS